jgi:hypothetical protein
MSLLFWGNISLRGIRVVGWLVAGRLVGGGGDSDRRIVVAAVGCLGPFAWLFLYLLSRSLAAVSYLSVYVYIIQVYLVCDCYITTMQLD